MICCVALEFRVIRIYLVQPKKVYKQVADEVQKEVLFNGLQILLMFILKVKQNRAFWATVPSSSTKNGSAS